MDSYEVVDKSCLFCNIISGIEPGNIVYKDNLFVVIENKYPKAPIHLLVLDRFHHDKKILFQVSLLITTTLRIYFQQSIKLW